MDYRLYPYDIYPMYVSGAGYVITTDLVDELLDQATRSPKFPLEDAFTTGILLKIVGGKVFSTPGWLYGFLDSDLNSVCSIRSNDAVVITDLTITQMFQIWKQLKSVRC